MMKVKCILSHEKPMGRVFKAGKVYELAEYENRFFVPVEQPVTENGDGVNKTEKKGRKYKKTEMYN